MAKWGQVPIEDLIAELKKVDEMLDTNKTATRVEAHRLMNDPTMTAEDRQRSRQSLAASGETYAQLSESRGEILRRIREHEPQERKKD
jgi:hypothetical protein